MGTWSNWGPSQARGAWRRSPLRDLLSLRSAAPRASYASGRAGRRGHRRRRPFAAHRCEGGSPKTSRQQRERRRGARSRARWRPRRRWSPAPARARREPDAGAPAARAGRSRPRSLLYRELDAPDRDVELARRRPERHRRSQGIVELAPEPLLHRDRQRSPARTRALQLQLTGRGHGEERQPQRSSMSSRAPGPCRPERQLFARLEQGNALLDHCRSASPGGRLGHHRRGASRRQQMLRRGQGWSSAVAGGPARDYVNPHPSTCVEASNRTAGGETTTSRRFTETPFRRRSRPYGKKQAGGVRRQGCDEPCRAGETSVLQIFAASEIDADELSGRALPRAGRLPTSSPAEDAGWSHRCPTR